MAEERPGGRFVKSAQSWCRFCNRMFRGHVTCLDGILSARAAHEKRCGLVRAGRVGGERQAASHA
jgi:hypothetical protein